MNALERPAQDIEMVTPSSAVENEEHTQGASNAQNVTSSNSPAAPTVG